ncbi:MAG: polysaccharide deacetylase family protein [Jatrophihabitans sp.]|uniref:polysaccharide deacetylase family protein n=1 Tax=Jatrophihabitans sp. TaxID=1932789 RepID=UPI003F7FA939
MAVKQRVRRLLAPVGSVVAVRTDAATAVLTYDDGPEPGGTDDVLAALADRGVRATFFVLLTRARLHRGLLDEVVAAGHEIALHGTDHRRLTTLPAKEVLRRCIDGRGELEDLTGAPVRWMRPPYGAQTPTTWLAIRRAGLVPVLWGPSSWDWRPADHDVRLARVREGARAGSILLCHDGFADHRDGVDDGPGPAVDRRRLTADILDIYAERGLTPRPLGAAVEGGSLIREGRFVR